MLANLAHLSGVSPLVVCAVGSRVLAATVRRNLACAGNFHSYGGYGLDRGLRGMTVVGPGILLDSRPTDIACNARRTVPL